MTFTPEIIPDPDQAVLKDSQGQFDLDTPFNVKQAATSMRRHRWFDVRDIGTSQGPYATTSGLAAGSLMRVQFDHRPDVIIVSISGETASTGACRLYAGEEGGSFIRLLSGGYACIPAPENGVVSIRNVGSTPTYGTLAAVAGFPDMPNIGIACGGAGGTAGPFSSPLTVSPAGVITSQSGPASLYAAGAPLTLGVNGAGQWQVNVNGHLTTTIDNTYDIGINGGIRPRNLYCANYGVFGGQVSCQWVQFSPSNLNLLAGSGAPNPASGGNGDFYLRQDTPAVANQRLYNKQAGAWVGIL